MQTEKIPYAASLDSKSVLKRLHEIREMSQKDWIDGHGSGTLRKNARLGMRYQKQYRHERICFEFGHGFEICPSTYITFNDAQTEADCKSITEAGWHIDRLITRRIFVEDHFEVKYIHHEEPNGFRREGVGVILRATTCSWIPESQLVFCIIAEYDLKTRDFKPAINPC